MKPGGEPDLRTRITKILGRELAAPRVSLGDIADALIAALELKEERWTTDWPTPDGERAIATRVVSEWRHYHGCTCGWCVR
jgi:hypothetical protein